MIINLLTLIVLTLTLATVFWYTFVTRRMQQAVVAQTNELVHQRRLNNMPAFVAEINHTNGADYLQLTNLGKGIAINVAIDDVEVRYPTSGRGRIEFEKSPLMVRAGSSVNLQSNFLDSVFGYTQNNLTFLGSKAHFDADVTIRFQDIEGTNYIQTMRMGKNGYYHGFVKLVDAT